METTRTQQVIFTLSARCRDCYRCLRVCPVKAIRMENGQASIDETRCIKCGTCIRECPQEAKAYRNDVERAQRLLLSGAPVAVSLAPSFAAVYPEWQARRLPGALRRLGVSYVAETSVAAGPVAKESLSLMRNRRTPSICSACPAVVTYIEKYVPALTPHLLEVASPMVAHARKIKAEKGNNWKIIFIGPCLAKKNEAERDDVTGLIDAVLTFGELDDWFEKKGIDLATCEESDFDEQPGKDARYFPVPGGLIKAGHMETDGLRVDVVKSGGFRELKEALAHVESEEEPFLLEPLFCEEGCVNGPGIRRRTNLFERRRNLLRYAERPVTNGPEPEINSDLMRVHFKPNAIATKKYSEEDILRVLDRTGKADPAQQLNCGACGYDSCREKSIAVLQGMAEPEMCIPYMRRLAEQRTDRIIETSPNGILILDDSLHILSMNPTFRKFFMCGDPVLGKHVSYLMDPAPFEKVVANVVDRVELTVPYKPYNLLLHEIFYALREEKQFVGVFADVTAYQDNAQRLEDIKQQTVIQAKELLEHQIHMAQKIALFLGESTAQGEELVQKLMSLTNDRTPKA